MFFWVRRCGGQIMRCGGQIVRHCRTMLSLRKLSSQPDTNWSDWLFAFQRNSKLSPRTSTEKLQSQQSSQKSTSGSYTFEAIVEAEKESKVNHTQFFGSPVVQTTCMPFPPQHLQHAQAYWSWLGGTLSKPSTNIFLISVRVKIGYDGFERGLTSFIELYSDVLPVVRKIFFK